MYIMNFCKSDLKQCVVKRFTNKNGLDTSFRIRAHGEEVAQGGDSTLNELGLGKLYAELFGMR